MVETVVKGAGILGESKTVCKQCGVVLPVNQLRICFGCYLKNKEVGGGDVPKKAGIKNGGLTELETRLMLVIPKDDFYENGFDSWLWNDCFLDTLERYAKIGSKQGRALLASLDKKGFLSVDGGKDGSFRLLEPAKRFLLDRGLVDDIGREVREQE